MGETAKNGYLCQADFFTRAEPGLFVTFLWTPLEQKKMEFCFYHNKASLKFSAQYDHKCGARHEWVNLEKGLRKVL